MMEKINPGRQLDETAFQANFNRLDKNHDGNVSFEELVSVAVEKAGADGILIE